MSVPLEVRLSTSRRTMMVTTDAQDLSYSTGVPGGYKSCTVPLTRSLTLQSDEIAAYATLTVMDGRSQQTVWEGRLEDPSRDGGDSGELWTLTAVGPAAHAQDRTRPYIVIDDPMASVVRSDNNFTPGGTDSTGDDPGGSGNTSLVLQFPAGIPIANNGRVVMRYSVILDAGQSIGSYNYAWDGGTTSAVSVEAVTRTGSGAGTATRSDALVAAGGVLARKVVVTDFTSGNDNIDFRILRTGVGVTYGTDDVWASFFTMRVRALLKNANGTDKTTGYTADTVLLSEVAADLLGRFLNKYDGAIASIATTTHGFDQIAYPAGVTPQQVLDDLLALEPDFYWQALHDGYFELAAWPTRVRYEVDLDDASLSLPGSTDGLYNECTVIWKDWRDRSRSAVLTNPVQALTDAGLTRGVILDLGPQVGSTVNATRGGQQFLLQHATPPNAGSATVSVPIMDLYTGRKVDPWEIKPGHLIRIRGVNAAGQGDLNVGRNGVTIFRLTEMGYSQSSNTANLSLDATPISLPAQVAHLRRHQARLRRTR